MPPAAVQRHLRYEDTAADAGNQGWTTRGPRPRGGAWSCSCGFITNFGIRTTCYQCDRPRPCNATFGEVAYVTNSKGRGKSAPARPARRAPWANEPISSTTSPANSPSSFSRTDSGHPTSAKQLLRAWKGMFPGTEDSDVYKGIAAKAEEEKAARRAAVSPLTALRQIDTRIANLTRRERKLTVTVAELRTELDATEDDLETARAELAAATTKRGAIAARAAIPNAKDVKEVEQVADTSTQTLGRLGDLPEHSNAADALRGLLGQAAEHVRILAAEATPSLTLPCHSGRQRIRPLP